MAGREDRGTLRDEGFLLAEGFALMGPVATTALAPDDLLKMSDGERFELVDGRLVERDLGSRSSHVGGFAFRRIANYCEEHGLGWAYPAGCGYQCFPQDPGRVRRPDALFIRLGRLPGEVTPEGFLRIAPDLAVEVLSPNDLDYETDRKVEDFLSAGTQLVWVVNPETRTVLIYRADGSIQGLREADELAGEQILPGFRCRVGDLFATPGGSSMDSV